MTSYQSFQLVSEFRTVVSGYRLHGELLQAQNQQPIFSLKISSSSNQQQKYHIVFDHSVIQEYKLKDSFPDSKALYDHLSKMTKMKVRLNTSAKVLSIIHQKKKLMSQFPIELLSIKEAQLCIDKKQTETTFSEEKQQFFTDALDDYKDQKQQNLPFSETSYQHPVILELSMNSPAEQQVQQTLIQQVQAQHKIEQVMSPQAKILQLEKYFELIKSKNQPTKSLRQIKKITYNFLKSQSEAHNLYEFAINSKVQLLADLIESQQLDKTDQIILKRFKILQVPPFNQIVLENVKVLSLQENKITKILNLEKMPNLEKINLDGNKISRIQNLSHLVHLKLLKIGNNNIQKIQGLEGLSSLETLWLDFNSISKIQGLQSLQKLKALNLSFNLIKKIENLDHLLNLQELLLNENQISQIQNLDKFSKLTKLSINMNSISKIRGLKKLLFLEVVYLNENQIEEFDRAAFQELNWLKMLKQLKINDNFIDWTEESKGFVERLRNYGVKISI